MLLLGAFAVASFCAYAQTEDENGSDGQGTEASVHGKAVSDLAKTTTATGREKGSIISSSARAKGLLMANSNASFNRSGVPQNSNGQPSDLPTTNGQPTTLPPLTAPTTGQPTVTPVSKPIGVPVGSKPTTIPGGN